MPDMHRPTDGDQRSRLWRRLLGVVEQPSTSCDEPTLGEYAAICVRHGADEAGRCFPALAAHLAGGCHTCAENLRTLTVFLEHD